MATKNIRDQIKNLNEQEVSAFFRKDAIDRVIEISDADGIIMQSDWIGPGYRELFREYGNGTRLSYLDGGYDAVKRIVKQDYLAAKGNKTFVERDGLFVGRLAIDGSIPQFKNVNRLGSPLHHDTIQLAVKQLRHPFQSGS